MMGSQRVNIAGEITEQILTALGLQANLEARRAVNNILNRACITSSDHMEISSRGGLVGGPARAKSLTANRRSDIARHAANVRWGNE